MKNFPTLLPIFFALLLSVMAAHAQAPIFAWANRAGGTAIDYGRDIAVDGNGNSYITGSFQGSATFGSTTLTSSGNSDVFIAKYDAVGQCRLGAEGRRNSRSMRRWHSGRR